LKVTKRRRIRNELLVFGIKGELLEVIERNLDHQMALDLKRKLNSRRTEKEKDEIEYWVEED